MVELFGFSLVWLAYSAIPSVEYSFPDPTVLLHFDTKVTCAERVARGEFSVAETVIAVSPRGFVDTRLWARPVFSAREKMDYHTIEGPDLFLLFQLNSIEWARDYGFDFDWFEPKEIFTFTLQSNMLDRFHWQKSARIDEIIMPICAGLDAPQKRRLLALCEEEASLIEMPSDWRCDFEKQLLAIFDAHRIYSETWAARWFPESEKGLMCMRHES